MFAGPFLAVIPKAISTAGVAIWGTSGRGTLLCGHRLGISGKNAVRGADGSDDVKKKLRF